ncbi:dephospho-CoA kinase [Caproiciproducens sp. MSJ-32]|uniref:dephospho-CoA kinase n=1 Tax=Caproiciproducens sp. MSJ-32 TaxID=2841527 RepID=UPI001C12710D|nr:dephospho-CoA kinase [Caproiciproducens sp. MSJ-32]MBU5455433.1 dephospho-CoA kinase [Caproiciproducens sp. MSJ-32]
MKHNNCKIIGITGGIATGKSTVTSMLIEKGYKVIDADKIAKQVVSKDSSVYREIVTYFGEDILKNDGTIDRKKLGNLVFRDEYSRKKLNDIVHPHVLLTIKETIKRNMEKEKILFIDVPLLIEEIDNLKKYGIVFDEIWLVYTDEKTQLNRLIRRNGISEEEAIYRIKSQMPIDVKKRYVTRIIDNRGDKKRLEEQVDEVLKEII